MNMTRTLLSALAILTVSCTSVGTRLDTFAGDLHQRGLFDGAIVVGDARGIIWEKGYGLANREQNVPFTPSTPADGGSLAKTVTAALVLDLAREGVVDLDAPVQRYLPELPWKTITLRHLLSHSGGIPVADYDWFDPFLPAPAIRTTGALLKVLETQRPPLAFEPGTRFEYSSLGYDLAALAAARAAGKSSFAQLAQERFFVPLGFTDSFFRPARFADFPGVRTLGYRVVDGKAALNDVFDYEGFHGGSNIYFSARDLHRWNASFFDRSESQEMAKIGSGTSGLTLGSWYRSADGTMFSYAGHLQGFHDEAFRDMKTKQSIVYLSNNSLEPWMQHALVRGIRAILAGGNPTPAQPPAVVAVSKEDLPRLNGTWMLGETRGVIKDGTIERDGVVYRMFQVRPHAFYVPGLDLVLGFADDLTRMYYSNHFEEGWGERKVS